MRVSMNIVPDKEWISFFRKQDVHMLVIDVQLTEEEKYLIKKLGIDKIDLFTAPILDNDAQRRQIAINNGWTGWRYDIGELLTRTTFKVPFDRLHDAKNAIPVIENSFTVLKQTLDSADQPVQRTFEL